MNEKVEKKKLKEAHKIYTDEVTQLWSKLVEKYKFDNETALLIIGNFWYEPDYAEEFKDEWNEGIDKIGDNIEKQFNVLIEHEEELITVRNEIFVCVGNLIIEEEKL